jgi:hypothetical protein
MTELLGHASGWCVAMMTVGENDRDSDYSVYQALLPKQLLFLVQSHEVCSNEFHLILP